MAQPFVEPTEIRCAAKPGEKVKQEFVVNVVPSGDLMASISGGNNLIRLEDFVAYRKDRHPMSEEEIRELPPSLRNEARRNGWVEYVEVGRAKEGEPLHVSPNLHVRGNITFASPEEQAESTLNAKLVLEGWGTIRIEIPLQFIIGNIQVEFLNRPIIAYCGQEVSVPVRVSMSPGSPLTNLTLRAFEANFDIPFVSITVPPGGSADATLKLRTSPTAPLGPTITRLSIDGFSGQTILIPFGVTVQAFSQKIQALEQIQKKAELTNEGPPGPRRPISDVEDTGGGGFVQRYSSGDIYWHPDIGAKWVYGAILSKYRNLGGPMSLLGYPRRDEIPTSDGQGRMSEFERGDIYFNSQAGANEVHGTIRERWKKLGAEKSYLGYPTFDQRGQMSRFQTGTIQTLSDGFTFDVSDVREFISRIIHVDGAAANGWCELRLSSTGGWKYKGSMRSTGALSYDVMMVTTVDLRSVGGPVLAFAEKGDVEGTLVLGGIRAHTWDTYNMEDKIKEFWPAIQGGAPIKSTFTVEFGPGDLLALVASVIGIPAFVIVLIVGAAALASTKKRCGRYRGNEYYSPELGQWTHHEGDVWIDKDEICPPLDP